MALSIGFAVGWAIINLAGMGTSEHTWVTIGAILALGMHDIAEILDKP